MTRKPSDARGSLAGSPLTVKEHARRLAVPTMSDYLRCDTCQATMHRIIWDSHLRSKQHRDGTRELEVTPLKMARSLLTLSAAFVVLAWIAYVLGHDAWPFVYVAVLALVGGVVVGRRW
jgi:predicted small integral membrane protein